MIIEEMSGPRLKNPGFKGCVWMMRAVDSRVVGFHHHKAELLLSRMHSLLEKQVLKSCALLRVWGSGSTPLGWRFPPAVSTHCPRPCTCAQDSGFEDLAELCGSACRSCRSCASGGVD